MGMPENPQKGMNIAPDGLEETTVAEHVESDVSFWEAIGICFRKYATFSGRASVKEYGFFRLFYAIILLSLGAIWLLIPSSVVLYAFFLTVAVFFMPICASTVRRLHDTETSGLYIFMVFIPIIGAKLLLVKLCQKGDSGENQYGGDPKTD